HLRPRLGEVELIARRDLRPLFGRRVGDLHRLVVAQDRPQLHAPGGVEQEYVTRQEGLPVVPDLLHRDVPVRQAGDPDDHVRVDTTTGLPMLSTQPHHIWSMSGVYTVNQ